jgi:hypothetical protein
VVPAAGDALQAGRQLLIGSAVDERARRLRGRSLTWFAGSRRIGTGERIWATLPAGRLTLTLRARDARGRSDVSRRTMPSTPVTLQLKRLATPARVRPRARHVAVTLATTVAATARAGGRSYRVGPHARRLLLRLPARPRTGILKLRLSITARGARQRNVHTTIVVLRS